MSREAAARIAVIGGGIMGSGIAQTFAVHGYEVAVRDLSDPLVQRSRELVTRGAFGLESSVRRRKLTAAEARAAAERIRFTTDLATACNGSDLVIEAIPENLKAKMQLFAEVDSLVHDGALLCSNTAGFPITALAQATRNPARVLGWHWAQPCNVMRLAEIVAHEDADAGALATVVSVAEKLGKRPIVIRDQPLAWGFVTNRINAAIRREAMQLVQEGVATQEQVDLLMKDCFRWPTGIFEMLSMNERNARSAEKR